MRSATRHVSAGPRCANTSAISSWVRVDGLVRLGEEQGGGRLVDSICKAAITHQRDCRSCEAGKSEPDTVCLVATRFIIAFVLNKAISFLHHREWTNRIHYLFCKKYKKPIFI